MSLILNILVDGIAYGMVVFMISVGLSVTLGLMRVVNLAHGGFAMLGGVQVHWLASDLGLSFWTAVPVALVGTVMIALPLERFLYRRIYNWGELQQVLATIGLTFIMIAAVNAWQGSTVLSIPLPGHLMQSVDLGFRTLPAHRVLVVLLGLFVIACLWLLLEQTTFGIELRAAVDDRQTASSIGIDTSLVYMTTFGIGAFLAALGGIFGAELLPVTAYYPLHYMVVFLVVVSVGGMGSIAGSFVAAIGLGIAETGARYLLPDWATFVFFLIVILVLTVKPDGLLGRAAA